MHAHPSWEVGGSMSQRGVQTNALVNRGKLVPKGFIPLRETAAPCKAVPCPTCRALGGIRKQCDEWRSFSCTLPTAHLGSYTPVSTSVKRRGVLEITGSCDGRNLLIKLIKRISDYQLTCSPPPKAETAQQWRCSWHPICQHRTQETQRQCYEFYYCRNGTQGRLHTRTKGSAEFCSQGCRELLIV